MQQCSESGLERRCCARRTCSFSLNARTISQDARSRAMRQPAERATRTAVSSKPSLRRTNAFLVLHTVDNVH